MDDRLDTIRKAKSTPSPIARGEIAAVLLALAVFAMAAVSFSPRWSPPWQDEVQDAEIPANLLAGEGFVSRAKMWFEFQPIANLLYTACLSLWLSAFGLGIQSVRCFDCAMMIPFVLAVWAGTARFGLIRSAFLRVLFVLVTILNHATGQVYINNRHDSAGMVVVACMFLALTVKTLRWRLCGLFCGGLLLGMSGLQFIPFAGFLSILALVLLRGSVWKDVLAAAVGGLAGLSIVYAVWRCHGIGIHEFLSGFSSEITYLGGRPNQTFLGSLFVDRSMNLILLGLAMTVVVSPARFLPFLRTPLGVAACCAILIPCVMRLSGRYYHMYVWMAFVPASMALIRAIEDEAAERSFWRFPHLVAVILAALVGFPVTLVLTSLDWSTNGYPRVEEFVSRNLTAEDVVFSSYAAYYPAKRSARTVWLPDGLSSINEERKKLLSAIIIDGWDPPSEGSMEERAQRLLRRMGGDWVLCDRLTIPHAALWRKVRPSGSALQYDLMIYRRQARTAPSEERAFRKVPETSMEITRGAP